MFKRCCHLLLATFLGGIFGIQGSTLAAENTATGSIAGTAGTLTPSATVKLNVVELQLIKQVRNSQGYLLKRDTGSANGATLWFVIYVNNEIASTVEDIQVEDVVANGPNNFTVQELATGFHAEAIDIPGVTVGSEDIKITENWTNTWQPISDAVGDHVGALNTGEYDAAQQKFSFGTAANPANIPGNTLRAYRFKVVIN